MLKSAAEPRKSRPEQVRLDIKVVERRDLNQVLSTMNNPSTVRNVAFMRWPMGIDQAQGWASSSIDDGRDDRFVARLSGTNEVVGCSSLWQSPDEAPELGYWIMEGRRGLGLGFELANLTLRYAEDNWGARRFTAFTSLSNPPSQQILTKLGFQIAGEMTIKTGDGELRPSLKWLRCN
jgi:RimJ/RimL family protein N-acetyltransferase